MWFSRNFGIFNSKLFLLACHKHFWPKNVFLPFCQKIFIFSKIWYQNWDLRLISIPEMYTFIYISVIIWKLQHSICFFKKWVHTPLNVQKNVRIPKAVQNAPNMSKINSMNELTLDACDFDNESLSDRVLLLLFLGLLGLGVVIGGGDTGGGVPGDPPRSNGEAGLPPCPLYWNDLDGLKLLTVSPREICFRLSRKSSNVSGSLSQYRNSSSTLSFRIGWRDIVDNGMVLCLGNDRACFFLLFFKFKMKEWWTNPFLEFLVVWPYGMRVWVAATAC